jgi:HK97 gp10 family phage protein
MSAVNINVTVTIDTSPLDALNTALPGRAKVAIMKGAYMVESDAKQFAPVDTGALRNSIETTEGNGISAIVRDGVEYGKYQEFGTMKMPAQPFMIPAIEKNRDNIISLLAGIFK